MVTLPWGCFLVVLQQGAYSEQHAVHQALHTGVSGLLDSQPSSRQLNGHHLLTSAQISNSQCCNMLDDYTGALHC